MANSFENILPFKTICKKNNIDKESFFNYLQKEKGTEDTVIVIIRMNYSFVTIQ